MQWMDFDRKRLREGCSELLIDPKQTGLRFDRMIEKRRTGDRKRLGLMDND